MSDLNLIKTQLIYNLLPIELCSVSFYKSGIRLIDRVSFKLSSKGITVILGPNGAGKSILLRLMHGLDTPNEGKILFKGVVADEKIRRNQAMVFQNAILLRRSVIENLSFVANLHKPKKSSNLTELLAEVGLADKQHMPARRLSGGEKQRLSLARALVCQPELLLLDEPTASLDPYSVQMIETLLTKLQHQNTKIIFITHDLKQACRLAEDIIFIHKGKLEAFQPADAFFEKPDSDSAQAFISGRLIF